MIFGMNVSTAFPLILGTLGVITLIGIGVMYVLNQKYPKVTFELYDGNTSRIKTYRQMGSSVVDGGILDVLLSPKKLRKWSLDDFYYTHHTQYLFGIYPQTYKQYIATEKMGELIPMRYNPNEEINMKVIKASKDLVNGWINSQQMADRLTAKNQPLISVLINVLPALLVLIAFSIIMYIMMQGITDANKEVINVSAQVLDRADNMLDKISPICDGGITKNYTIVIVSIICFFVGIIAGFLVAWLRYFWRHFLYR